MKNQRLAIILALPFLLAGCSRSKSFTPKKLDPETHYDNVYLIMGQSNASGCSEWSNLNVKDHAVYEKYVVGNEKVKIAYDVDQRVGNEFVPVRFGQGANEYMFGPEIGIAETLSEQEEPSYIVKGTWGGTCLMTQYVSPKGKKLDLYNRYVDFIKGRMKLLESRNKHPRIRGVFWMQGESDSFLDYRDKYGEVEKCFLDYLKHDLNDYIYEYFNFVDAYIKTEGLCWVEPEVINECKQKIADENEHCYCIKTNGEDETAIKLYLKCETGEAEDLAHYDSPSELLLGKVAGQLLLK